MSFSAKNIVITGGAGEIALELVQHLLDHGAENIALLDIDQRIESITKICNANPTKQIRFYLTDVSSRSNLEQVFKEVIDTFHSIDAIIACAGVFDELDYERTVNINLLGLMHTNHIGLSYMSKCKGGSGGIIVNISSVAGIDCSQFSTPTYNATKHGVVAFTRSFGDEFYYQETGVRFLTICPGVTLTKFLDDVPQRCYSVEAFTKSKQKLEHMMQQTVAEFAAAFLEVIREAKNGTVWLIDGGKYKEIEYKNHWFDNVNDVTSQ
ncbi:alcohol dehydrogenase 1-like [Bradysia coprophila]|uniref:alcohol dehydrogenase 1-like n=1 Tax=Bradysia coprophila TaxID=38358 RepID=UPI00187DAB1B|nr:alcohol dehydrogenase 1-like [Bradysia coprophila]